MKNLILSLLLVSSPYLKAATITENTFNDLGETIAGLYEAELKVKDWSLSIEPDWISSEDNATMVTRNAPYYSLRYEGGLIKKNKLSQDALSIVLCHEMGHLLGKRIPGEDGLISASPEGEADYFATQNCLKKLWKNNTELTEVISTVEMNHLKKRLAKFKIISGSKDEMRSIRMAVAAFESLQKNVSKAISFSKEDKSQVRETLDDYPSAQCRLDTYFAGIVNAKRPRCWFKVLL